MHAQISDTLNAPELQELQRFAELGRLSASLLHEINNPLTAALLRLEMSQDDSSVLTQVRRDIEQLRRYVESARQQARYQSQSTIFYVRPQINQLKRIVRPLAKQAGVRLAIGLVPKCKLLGDPVKFQQVIANLVINAVQAYGKCGYDQASLVRLDFSKTKQWLIIQVSDWGKGITASEMPQLFQPFYTTKDQTGHSLGIGLALVKQYVTDDFDGSIKVSSSRRRGTQFTIKLRLSAG